MIKGLIFIFLWVFLDQISKFFIDTQIVLDKPIYICDYFNIIKVWNTGVSFSMFNNYGKIGTIILVLVALSIVLFLLNWMRKEDNTLKALSLSMIIGGAIGNIIDRIRCGAVLDFLDFHYNANHWPAFNLADTFICIGAFILIVMEIINSRKKGLNEV